MEKLNDLNGLMNTITKGDAADVLSTFPDESVDLIFADPPYNLQLNNELRRPDQSLVNGVDDEWDKFRSFQDYDNFTSGWLTECKRILRKNGVFWAIGTYHNIFRVGRIMQDLGFWIINDVVWIKSNPMPNFKGTRFTNSHEILIFATKDRKSKYTFHYKSMKAYNDDLQMRSDWTIPICGGIERIKIGGERAHSTQKPEELIRRIILATSSPGDTVLDPFMGSGTTGAVAKRLSRNFIGIEREDRYIKIAMERISSVVPLEDRYLRYPLEIKPPRVPFGDLVAFGLVKEGEMLYSKNENFTAVVLANGTIESGDITGSIHSVGAKILGKPAYNGWSLWNVMRDGGLISIDSLREKYIRGCLTPK